MAENTVAGAPEQQEQKPQRNKYSSDRKKHRMPKWLKIALPILLVAGIVYGAWAIVQKITAKNDSGVIEGTVATNTLADQITGWSTISAKKTAQYGIGLTGTVTEIAVKAGDTVKAGDLLFVIDPVQLKDELAAAEKTLSAAKKALEDISAKLAYTEVTAPFKGKLIKVGDLKVGDQGSEGAAVGTLVDDETMRLELYFVRSFFGKIKVGQTATVSLPDQMQEISGTVAQIDDIEKPVDGSLCFRVYKIDFKNPGVLAAGATATASVATANGAVTPIAAGTMNYCRSVDLILKAGGEVSFSDLVEYGNYASGQKLLAINTSQLHEQIDGAQKTYDDANEAAQKIRDKIQKTEIRSEIDGMVSGIVIEVGTKLENSTTASITVSDTSSLVVNINIDELDISKVSLGMQVSLTNDSGLARYRHNYLYQLYRDCLAGQRSRNERHVPRYRCAR